MENVIDLASYMRCHHCGDWGDLNADDKQANEEAIADGTRILSDYRTTGGEKIYIITEHDRMTTVTLATEH